MSDFENESMDLLELTVTGAPDVLVPGETQEITLTLFSNADSVDEVRLEVVGLDPAWVRYAPAARIPVFPGELANAAVKLTAPREAAPGTYPYTLQAHSNFAPGGVIEQHFETRVLQLGPAPKPPEPPAATVPAPAEPVVTVTPPAAPYVPPAPEPVAATPPPVVPVVTPPPVPTQAPAAPAPAGIWAEVADTGSTVVIAPVVAPPPAAPPAAPAPPSAMPAAPPVMPAAPQAEPPQVSLGGQTIISPYVAPAPPPPAPPPTPSPVPGMQMPRSVVPLPAGGDMPATPEGPGQAGDQELRSARITVTLDQAMISVNPGEVAVVSGQVTNSGGIIDTLSLSVAGLPLTWIAMERPSLTLHPGESGQLTFTIKPPPKTRAGELQAYVRARSESSAVEVTEQALRVVVNPFVDFQMGIQPQQGTGQFRATYAVRITNRSNVRTTLAFSGHDEGRLCTYQFEPLRLTLDPDAEGQVRLQVQAIDRVPGNQTRLVMFSITATPTEQFGLARQATAQFMQTPMIPASMELRPTVVKDMQQGQFTVHFTNPGDAEMTAALSALDPQESCLFVFDPPLIKVPANGSADARLTVRTRKLHTGDAPKQYDFTVSATPADGAPSPAAVRGQFVQMPVPDVKLSLHPPQASKTGRASFKVVMQNPRPVPVTVELKAADENDACEYSFRPETLTVAPGKRGQATLRVKPKDKLMPDERRKVHVFKVTAKLYEGAEQHPIEGRLAQVPGTDFGSILSRAFKILLILGLLLLVFTGLGTACQLRYLLIGIPSSSLPGDLRTTLDTACQYTNLVDPLSKPIAKIYTDFRGAQATASAQDVQKQIAAATATAAALAGLPPPVLTPPPGGSGPAPIISGTQESLGAYNFVLQAKTAAWSNETGFTINFDDMPNANNGFATVMTRTLEDGNTYAQVLEMRPKQSSLGYIVGKYAVPLTVAPGAQFRAHVGFLKDATQGSVTFRVWFKSATTTQRLDERTKNYDGTLPEIVIDLTNYAGQSGEFWLMVLAGDNPTGDFAVWVNPRIEQP